MTSGVSRLAKLRAMSAAEVAYRVRYGAYKAWERRLHRRGRLAPPDRLRRALRRDLPRGEHWAVALASRPPATVFFRGVSDTANAPEHFARRFGPELEKARSVAAAASDHVLDFFGQEFRFGPSIDWHADPVTGAAWPRRYHADVPVHGGDTGYGDVKHVWELNRHQFFVDLAKVACVDRSRPHAETLGALLADWQRAVPCGTGAPWACALEPAFRAWSWLWAYHMLWSAGMLGTAEHVAWLTGLLDHARFLYQHLEIYSSPYNHLAGEASALFALGTLLPEFAEARRWQARGRAVLEGTLPSQFHADGGTVEQSTFYHHATLGFYLLSAILGRDNGADLSGDVWRAIERGIDFSVALMQPDGRLPAIGGADDGKPIRLEHLPFWDFRPYYAIGAVLFDRPDFKHAASRFWEDAWWVLGEEGSAIFEARGSTEPERMRALPASGYYVARTDWSAEADYLCFDCGEQAAGLHRNDVPSAAHGHADALSVVVRLGGREVLVDPGFYCYNGSPEWEVHFRRTLAHNTVVVDGLDQAQHLRKMAWTHTYVATPEGWAADAHVAWAAGRHDGFVRRAGVTHRRTAWLRDGGAVVLHDTLTGEGTHRAEIVFQFAPGPLAVDGNTAWFDDRFELAWSAAVPVTASVRAGGEHAADGWIARSLGVRVAAPRLVLDLPLAGGRLDVLTVIADRQRVPGSGARVVTDVAATAGGPALRARIRGEGWDDVVLAGPGALVSVGGITTDAPTAVVRTASGRVVEALRAGGSRIAAEAVEAPGAGAEG